MPGEAELNAPVVTQKSPPPPLPSRLLALAPIVYVGTAAWLVGFVLLALGHYVFDLVAPIWMWTALAGFALGLVGVPIMIWQRHAARRGSRGAQRID